jgi:hypothetical protein
MTEGDDAADGIRHRRPVKEGPEHVEDRGEQRRRPGVGCARGYECRDRVRGIVDPVRQREGESGRDRDDETGIHQANLGAEARAVGRASRTPRGQNTDCRSRRGEAWRPRALRLSPHRLARETAMTAPEPVPRIDA